MHILKELKKIDEDLKKIGSNRHSAVCSLERSGLKFLASILEKIKVPKNIEASCEVNQFQSSISFKNKNSDNVLQILFDLDRDKFLIKTSVDNIENEDIGEQAIYFQFISEVFIWGKENGKKYLEELKIIACLYLEAINASWENEYENKKRLINLKKITLDVFFVKVLEEGTSLPIFFKDCYTKFLKKGPKTCKRKIIFNDGRLSQINNLYLHEVKIACERQINKDYDGVIKDISSYYEKNKLKEKFSSISG